MHYFCLLKQLGASIFLVPVFKNPDEVRSGSVDLDVLTKVVWVNINSSPFSAVCGQRDKKCFKRSNGESPGKGQPE